MNYLKIALVWCFINFPVSFIAYKIDKNFYFSMLFLIGFFIILCFGFYEAYQKEKKYREDEK